MEEKLIAPCGMNCAICSAYLAYTHKVKARGIRMAYCAGCRPRDKQCAFLKKNCQLLLDRRITYCYECQDFPCERLRRIDHRYRTFFRMSMIENLERIMEDGIKEFLHSEEEKWRCPQCGQVICCHNGICFGCGLSKLRDKKQKYRWADD
ncbi:MAG: DUF3795 domain-containing protein [Chloroflexi bacterium]|nr:DUF3795 domain-containing protein [Chloroflexota bacterium]